MPPSTQPMTLRILLPSRIFMEKSGVQRMIAESPNGYFGLLPGRLDCVAVLVPGILVFQRENEGEVCLAVDDGILIKTGRKVTISVRNAIEGLSLEELQLAVENEFLQLKEGEGEMRRAMEKMETGFISSLARFHHE